MSHTDAQYGFEEISPAVQAADADPSRWISTNRQKPPLQQKRCNSWTKDAILKFLFPVSWNFTETTIN